MVATTLAASRELARAFQTHDHDKTYLALVLGVPRPYQGLIDAPLAKRGGKRDGGGLEKMAIDHEQGQHARTLYRVIEPMGKAASLVALRPLTGGRISSGRIWLLLAALFSVMVNMAAVKLSMPASPAFVCMLRISFCIMGQRSARRLVMILALPLPFSGLISRLH